MSLSHSPDLSPVSPFTPEGEESPTVTFHPDKGGSTIHVLESLGSMREDIESDEEHKPTIPNPTEAEIAQYKGTVKEFTKNIDELKFFGDHKKIINEAILQQKSIWSDIESVILRLPNPDPKLLNNLVKFKEFTDLLAENVVTANSRLCDNMFSDLVKTIKISQTNFTLTTLITEQLDDTEKEFFNSCANADPVIKANLLSGQIQRRKSFS